MNALEKSKSFILKRCLEITSQKSMLLNEQLEQLQQGLLSETKSSAGDKHETARAKIQFEIDQIHRQLNIVQNDQAILERCQQLKYFNKIDFGCLVKLNQDLFYVSCGWGKLDIDMDVQVFCISPEAPLYKAMKGLSIDDSFVFNHKTYRILGVV